MKRLVPFVLAASAFGGLTANASADENLKLDLADARNADINPANAPAMSSPLVAGAKYVVVVTGTGSIWAPKAWRTRGTCGVADTSPIFLSPGLNSLAAWDAATVYAAPQGAAIGPFGSDCATLNLPKSAIGTSGDRRAGPGGGTGAGFEFSAGREGRYARFEPIGGLRTTPRLDHTYFWSTTGTGKPLSFRFADDRSVDAAASSDNSGVFAIKILTEAECAATNCTARAGAEFDQQVPPSDAVTGAAGNTGLVPGATPSSGGTTGGTTGGGAVTVPTAAKQSVKVTGTRTCKRTPTITVQLSEPNGVDFRKVTYYFSGAKKRVLYRTTKKASRILVYTSGKKSGQIKPQKFTGLPTTKQYRLTLQITTTANQNLTVRRTIPACTKTKKTRKFS